MLTPRQISFLLCALAAVLVSVEARPDSAGQVPLPGPGLSYGGIPYGSMSGNVANYFRKTPPNAYSSNFKSAAAVDFAPIEQYL